jgi:hypothetical protein
MWKHVSPLAVNAGLTLTLEQWNALVKLMSTVDQPSIGRPSATNQALVEPPARHSLEVPNVVTTTYAE